MVYYGLSFGMFCGHLYVKIGLEDQVVIALTCDEFVYG